MLAAELAEALRGPGSCSSRTGGAGPPLVSHLLGTALEP